MKSQLTKQAVVVPATKADSSLGLERIALFTEEGAPFALGDAVNPGAVVLKDNTWVIASTADGDDIGGYQNTTGKPILVRASILLQVSVLASRSIFRLRIASTNAAGKPVADRQQYKAPTADALHELSMHGIVPVGWYFQITQQILSGDSMSAEIFSGSWQPLT